MSCCWFEIFECVRKLLLLGGPIFFEMGSASQLVVGLLVCFISSMVFVAYSPYVDEDDGQLAVLSQLALFFVLLSSIALTFEGASASATLGVLLVVTLAVPAVAAVLLHTGVCSSSILGFLGRRMFNAERTTVTSREPEPTDIEPPPSMLSTSSEPADAGEGVSNVLPPDAPALPPESPGAACRSETRASLGASAAMLAPPPQPAPPPRPTDEVELASTSTAEPAPTSQDSDARVGAVVGRARGNSLAEDALADMLAMSPPAKVEEDRTDLTATHTPAAEPPAEPATQSPLVTLPEPFAALTRRVSKLLSSDQTGEREQGSSSTSLAA